MSIKGAKMSDLAFRLPHFGASPLGAHAALGARFRALTGKWFARASLPVRELQPLNDRLLIDIGVDPRDVPRSSREETDRLCLIDRGWPSSRASRRSRPSGW